MYQHSSINSGCIKNLIATNCNCQIHECIKQIISLKSSQFNHLIKLLNLFASPYKICDQHQYPFEFFSEVENDIKCKFCLHEKNELKLIQNMTNLDTKIDLKKQFIEFPKLQDINNKRYQALRFKYFPDQQMNEEKEEEEDIKKVWLKRKKLKDTIEFLKLTTPIEVHNEFHDSMETIKEIPQTESKSCIVSVLELRDIILLNK